MNQRHLWTVVALLSAILGTPLSCRSQTSTAKVVPVASATPSPANDAVKVGEYQNKVNSSVTAAEIHTHSLAGKQAATVYLRNIPLLTFVGQEQAVSSGETKIGTVNNVGGIQMYAPSAMETTKVATVGIEGDLTVNPANSDEDVAVQKATVAASRINDLIRQKVDAKKITVSWQRNGAIEVANAWQDKNLSDQSATKGSYVIKFDGQELLRIDGNTRLPDSTNNPAQDALQATNRLRRLVGNASPLTTIENMPNRSPITIPGIGSPKLPTKVAVGPVTFTLRGKASFYGYDGSGNKTATGERFNPEAMTAAHRTLPFGTRVRVTNNNNGRSVVVRINDRGPFIRGRVIDLSYGAARVIGMISNGIAPVTVEVLGK
ncbi:septal ring lytic transglycosylase RlpA family protein [Calothrix sp. PCC 6303]|uniref:septal ring lytic transglycosylase RlpA family protein n=1 Tax=Calothrix sp. PCC 6303 TaxID=1170562 RepID=UPI0002A02542|nr:septal ring lytic transglycosylase RlpA family protein [Calothrix sp. PCC 6303]AFZ00484.1 rare lipoprotein A [Calothrix sp. PCC 6303]